MRRSEPVADLVVAGTGVAGLCAALRAAELGLRVVVVTKGEVEEGSTWWAQGGVAVAQPETGDSVEAHVADTLQAGGGLCDPRATRRILSRGPAAVRALRAAGAVFDADPAGVLQRTREGGHRAFRVIHAGGDATGAEIERTLAATARGGGLPLLTGRTVTDVLFDDVGRVAGVALLGGAGEQAPSVLRCRAVLLATGGLGQLYAVSTNPAVATADGVALALRAGAAAADLEFVQFHPTVLHTTPDAQGTRPLVTEAVRGEGAVLVDLTGRAVMTGVHPQGDLAPRDVVSAAIARRMADTGTDHVLLDATHLGSVGFRRRFPTVHGACARAGIDPGREPIPVTPAAHYQCGGVLTDTAGRTSVPALYAVGEVARTGLHGANRLASNSLLEGLVMGRAAAEAVADDRAAGGRVTAQPPGPPRPSSALREVARREAVQRAMSAHAGLGRDAEGLAAAAQVAATTAPAVLRGIADAEDASLTLVAAALLAAAAARTESRGCHVRADHPDVDMRWRRSIPVTLDETGTPVACVPVAGAPVGAARMGGAA